MRKRGWHVHCFDFGRVPAILRCCAWLCTAFACFVAYPMQGRAEAMPDGAKRAAPAEAPSTSESEDPAGNPWFEVAAGAGGLVASYALGIATTELLWEPLEPTDCYDDCHMGAILIGVGVMGLGALLLMPAAVTWAGDASGGTGNYGGALLGALAGAGLGIVAYAAGLDAGGRGGVAFAVAGVLVLPIVGATLGYRATADDRVQVALVPTGSLDGALAVLRLTSD